MFGLTPTPQPCRPEPLIFLRYDLGLDLDNTVRAAGAHSITVNAYHQGIESPPAVTTLTLEATFDGGRSWRPVRTYARGGGEFSATIRHPHGTEAVGLRVTAADSAGNTVDQTIPDAYTLR